METATGGEVEAWLVDAGGGSGEDTITCSPRGNGGGNNNLHCNTYTNGKLDDTSQCPGKCSTGNKCDWKGCHGKK